jgi:GDPmannose 4,6-dehydratase
MAKALVTGVSGQVGSYMAEYLLKKGYTVHGLNRRKSVDNFKNIQHILNDIKVIEGDITDAPSMNKVIKNGQYDEIYNAAAMSHVLTSFNQPAETMHINAVGVLNILEALEWFSNHTKLYQFSTSELFGSSKPPQNEDTPLHPCSPYGISKLAAYWFIRNYRESYNLKAANGMMHNVESCRRGDNFVTKKITNWVRKYKLDNTIEPLKLGNLDAIRDWSHAKDAVDAIYRICNQDKYRKDYKEGDLFRDYCFGSGVANDVRYFLIRALQLAFDLEMFTSRFAMLDFGRGTKERFIDKHNNDKEIVLISEDFFRPAEVDYLQCNPTKIKAELGWEPKLKLDDIIIEMLND